MKYFKNFDIFVIFLMPMTRISTQYTVGKTRLRIIFFYFYLNIPIPYARKIFKIFPYFSKIFPYFHIDKAIILVTLVL